MMNNGIQMGFMMFSPIFPRFPPESYPNVKELKDLLPVLVDCGDRRTWAPIGDNS